MSAASGDYFFHPGLFNFFDQLLGINRFFQQFQGLALHGLNPLIGGRVPGEQHNRGIGMLLWRHRARNRSAQKNE